MPHFYERNIVEIKQEYTTFLINILVPLIYEGIKSIYKRALKLNDKFVESASNNPDVEVPGVFKIFQICLKDIPTLNNHEIEIETNRIKERSKCSEYFDDLIKAVVKSNIVLLTFNSSQKQCDIVKEKHHEYIDTKMFIHNCYIECARIFYDNPELFWHEYTSLDIKRNQRESRELIKVAISEAIRKMLPIKLVLQEYLKNDYIQDDNNIETKIPNSQFVNIKSLLQRDLHDDDMNNFKEIAADEEENPDNDNIKDSLNHVKKQISNEDGDAVDDDHKIKDVESEDKKSNVFTKADDKKIRDDSEVQKKLNLPGYVAEPPAVKMSKEKQLQEMINIGLKNKDGSDRKEDTKKKENLYSESELPKENIRSHKKEDEKSHRRNDGKSYQDSHRDEKPHHNNDRSESMINIKVDRSYNESDKAEFFKRYLDN